MDDKKKEEEEKKDLLEQIIFNGYGIKIINRFNKDWGFKTLNRQEHAKVWSISTIVHDDATSWLNFKITVVKTALISINNIEVDDESKELIFPKLPTQVIDELFTEYQKLDKMQLEAIDNLEQIKEMSKDFFSRVRFKVMKSAGALPTEDRVKKMNDHQWFYYYYQHQSKFGRRSNYNLSVYKFHSDSRMNRHCHERQQRCSHQPALKYQALLGRCFFHHC